MPTLHKMYIIWYGILIWCSAVQGFLLPRTPRLLNYRPRMLLSAVNHERKSIFGSDMKPEKLLENEKEYFNLSARIEQYMKPAASKNPHMTEIVKVFLHQYADSCVEANWSPAKFQHNIVSFFRYVSQNMVSPYQFKPFHQALRRPIDYYEWGNNFLKPLIKSETSRLQGIDNAKKIQTLSKQGENVIIFSNHQTEADPQVISVLLESAGLGDLAEKMIFVAGHKVTTDPIAIPFSMGRNLICIHSKKHIKNPPEDFPKKQQQNLASMKALQDEFEKGGAVVWVAPSGGRDRSNDQNQFVVADFDSKAVDMFKILASKTSKKMHFFPMAMYTHELVPPPKEVSSSVGEERSAQRGSVSIDFLDETDGVGGLNDKPFVRNMQKRVEESYKQLCDWHDKQ